MSRLLVCLPQREEDNYAAVRFSFDGLDRSKEFNLEYHADQGNSGTIPFMEKKLFSMQ